MRFSCDGCKARYTIDDEKVRGRVLKIRCKKCSAVIIVRDELQSEETTRMMGVGELQHLMRAGGVPAAAPPPPPPAEQDPAEREWFAMIHGNQEGPFTEAALLAKVESGTVHGGTFLWHEALEDWARLSELPEANTFLAARAVEAPPLPKNVYSGPDRRARPTSAAEEAASSGAMAQGLAATDEANVEEHDEPARDEDEAGEDARAAAREHGEDEPPASSNSPAREAEAEAVTGDEPPSVSDSSAGGLSFGSGVHDPFASVPDAPGMVQAAPGESTQFFLAQAGVDSRGKRRRTRRILALFGVLCALFAGVLFFAPSYVLPTVAVQEDGTPVEDPGVFSVPGLEGLRDQLLGIKKPPSDARRTGPRAPSRAEDDPVIRRAEKTKAELDAEKKAELEMLYGGAKANPAVAGSGLGTLTERGPSVAPTLARKGAGEPALAPDKIMKVVQGNMGALTNCVDLHLRRNPNFRGGRVEVTFTIGSSGVVSRASLSDAGIDAGDLGSCIKDKTKRMIFPAFTGEPIDASFPLVLGSGG